MEKHATSKARAMLVYSGETPAQFCSPELALWCAVLESAIENLHGRELLPGGSETREGIMREARQWLVSCKNDEGSFLWVCDVLRLDPCAVRRAVLGIL